MIKKCPKCIESKEIEHFHRCSTTKDGLQNQCKNCTKLRHSSYKGKAQKKLYKQSDAGKLSIKKYDNSEKVSSIRREYQRTEKYKIKKRLYRKQYLEIKKNDIQFRLAHNLRARLQSALNYKSRSGSAIGDLGCSTAQLKLHLEAQFSIGMNWNNYGNGHDKWNIDHIIPLSKVDLTSREEFLKVSHYTNLRPMWAIENIKKGASICL